MPFGAVNGAAVNAVGVNGSDSIRYGALAQTQADNAIVSAGAVGIVGALTKTQTADALSFAGTAGIVGDLTKTQISDLLAATAGSTLSGAVLITQANNTLTYDITEGMQWYEHTRDDGALSAHSGNNPLTPHTGSSPLIVH